MNFDDALVHGGFDCCTVSSSPLLMMEGLRLFTGALINGIAKAIWMLIVGRISLGFAN